MVLSITVSTQEDLASSTGLLKIKEKNLPGENHVSMHHIINCNC